jgi:hypothetical protein
VNLLVNFLRVYEGFLYVNVFVDFLIFVLKIYV